MRSDYFDYLWGFWRLFWRLWCFGDYFGGVFGDYFGGVLEIILVGFLEIILVEPVCVVSNWGSEKKKKLNIFSIKSDSLFLLLQRLIFELKNSLETATNALKTATDRYDHVRRYLPAFQKYAEIAQVHAKASKKDKSTDLPSMDEGENKIEMDVKQ